MFNMMGYQCVLARFLLLIHKLLLDSDESVLLLLYDSNSFDVATKILSLNIDQNKVVYNINPGYNTEHKIMHHDDAIIISILTQSPAKASEFFDDMYTRDLMNLKSKHLFVMNQQPVDNVGVRKFITRFRTNNMHLVLLQLVSDDFNIYTFQVPNFPANEMINYTSLSALQIADNDVHDTIFPFKLRSIAVMYRGLFFYPPYLYQVHDHNSMLSPAAKFYDIDGIDVRILELLSEQWNWTVTFFLVDYNVATDNSSDRGIYQKFIGRNYRTIRRAKKQQAYKDTDFINMDRFMNSFNQ